VVHFETLIVADYFAESGTRKRRIVSIDLCNSRPKSHRYPIDPCHIRWPRVTLKIGTRDAKFFWRISAPTAIKFGTLTHVERDMLSGGQPLPPPKEVGTQHSHFFRRPPIYANTVWPRTTKIRHSNLSREKRYVLQSNVRPRLKEPGHQQTKISRVYNICQHGVT